jgi:hypothetical protein
MDGTPYQDRRIECTPEEVRLHGYYFPWGTKRVRYADIRSIGAGWGRMGPDGAGRGRRWRIGATRSTTPAFGDRSEN